MKNFSLTVPGEVNESIKVIKDEEGKGGLPQEGIVPSLSVPENPFPEKNENVTEVTSHSLKRKAGRRPSAVSGASRETIHVNVSKELFNVLSYEKFLLGNDGRCFRSLDEVLRWITVFYLRKQRPEVFAQVKNILVV